MQSIKNIVFEYEEITITTETKLSEVLRSDRFIMKAGNKWVTAETKTPILIGMNSFYISLLFFNGDLKRLKLIPVVTENCKTFGDYMELRYSRSSAEIIRADIGLPTIVEEVGPGDHFKGYMKAENDIAVYVTSATCDGRNMGDMGELYIEIKERKE